FLTVSRTGFCQQFATAMATMVRELGYPARVAVGYRPGTAREGAFTVQTKDAHAWVEVYFPGYGWLQFEPTPSRGLHPNASPGSYLNPGTPLPSEGSTGGQVNENGLGGGNAACDSPNGLPLQGQLCNTESRPNRGGTELPPGLFDRPGEATEEQGGYSVPYRLIFLVLLIAFGVLLVVMPIVKWGLRRSVMGRARDPRARVLAAYRVFDGEAADLGMGRREGETLEEQRARLAAAVAFSDGHLGRLATAATRAAYGPHAPSQEEADGTARDARIAIRDLRKSAGTIRRIAGIYRPGL
ncbi:MAG: transglutaminase-like domain-containing protein, partial [Actinomycetota bacterium]